MDRITAVTLLLAAILSVAIHAQVDIIVVLCIMALLWPEDQK